MDVEFVIWGKDRHSPHEQLLVSEKAGLKDRAAAERTMELLAHMGCFEMRVQEFNMGDGSEVAGMFAGAVGV